MSMRALLWMAADEYEKFVEGQEEERKLSHQRWAEVRSIMTWAGLEKIELHACLVLLAVRGLGDRRVLLRECPRECRSVPARVVIHLIDAKPEFLPSVGVLSSDTRKLVKGVLESLASFDIFQFLHGEAPIPALAALQKSSEQNS